MAETDRYIAHRPAWLASSRARCLTRRPFAAFTRVIAEGFPAESTLPADRAFAGRPRHRRNRDGQRRHRDSSGCEVFELQPSKLMGPAPHARALQPGPMALLSPWPGMRAWPQ